MGKRKSTGKRQRFEIFKRDGFKCAYCGRSPPEVLLHVDHVVAVANGGTDEVSNLITACADCNLGKAAVPLTSVAPSLEHQAEESRERAEQVRAYAEMVAEARTAEDATVRMISDAWYKPINPRPGEWSYRFSPDRAASVRRFLSLLPAPEVMEAVDIAHASTWKRGLGVSADSNGSISDGALFRYFCGVCWSKIHARQNARVG